MMFNTVSVPPPPSSLYWNLTCHVLNEHTTYLMGWNKVPYQTQEIHCTTPSPVNKKVVLSRLIIKFKEDLIKGSVYVTSMGFPSFRTMIANSAKNIQSESSDETDNLIK